MKSRRFFQPVGHRIGHAAAAGAAGIDGGNVLAVQIPQRPKQPVGQSFRLFFAAIGHGNTLRIQPQLLLEAQHPILGAKLPEDIMGRLLSGAGDNNHVAGGGIMGVFHARRANHRIPGDFAHHGPVNIQFAQQLPQLFRRNATGTQQPGPLTGDIHNGGFHAHPAGPAVYNSFDLPRHVVIDMLSGGGAGLAGNIGRGRGNGHSRPADNRPGHVVVRAAHPHGGKSRRGSSGNQILGGQNQRQRPGPEGFHQHPGLLGHIVAEVLHLIHSRHMENQRVILGPALCLKYFQHRIGIQTIGAQAIDRLRGNAQQSAVPDNIRRSVQRVRILGIQYFRIHSVSLS